MKFLTRLIPFLTLLFYAAAAFPYPAGGDRLPQQALYDLDGVSHNLNEWQGEVVILNFWATWCPPCLREIPAFISMQQELDDQKVQFVGIAIDDADAVADFAEQKQINYPTLLGEQSGLELSVKLGNKHFVLPYTAIFDRTGKLISTHRGELTRAEILKVITPLL